MYIQYKADKYNQEGSHPHIFTHTCIYNIKISRVYHMNELGVFC